jgi:hypothetical protein
VGVTVVAVVVGIAVLVPVLSWWIQWMVKTATHMPGLAAFSLGIAAWVGLAAIVSAGLAAVGSLTGR